MEKFNYQCKEEILNDIKKKGLTIPFCDDVSVLKKPIELNGKVIKNRILAQPVEGFDAMDDGSPSKRTHQRYCALAKGGSGALWLESTSVNHEGRSNKKQLWIREENWHEFKDLVDDIKAAVNGDIYLVLQLTHSGRYSHPEQEATPVCAYSSPIIPKENERIISDEELDALKLDYVKAAKLAEKAGFDAVDIRVCHGYLLNELLSAYSREGRYGGSFENRARLTIDICEAVKNECKIECGIRLNMFDGTPYPYGYGVKKVEGSIEEDYEEPLKLIDILYQKGVRLFNITNGIGAYSPFVIRPYDSGGKEPSEHQLVGINRMQYTARLCKQHAKDAIVISSGYSWLRQYASHVAAGGINEGYYDIAGFGRESIAYENYANDILNDGEVGISHQCRACCGCSNIIKIKREELECVFKDKLK